MTHTTKIRTIGNSSGVTISKAVLKQSKMNNGTEVSVEIVKEGILLKRTGTPYDVCMAALKKGQDRYPKTLDILSK